MSSNIIGLVGLLVAAGSLGWMLCSLWIYSRSLKNIGRKMEERERQWDIRDEIHKQLKEYLEKKED